MIPVGARGPVLMAGAALSFALMVACVKLASPGLEAVELVFWRSWVAIPLALGFARREVHDPSPGRKPGDGGIFDVSNRRLLALRCVLGFSAMLCFYTAARGLSVADLNLVGRLQPILIAILAPVVLGRGERPAGGVWVVLGAGLFGCGILLGPQLQLGQAAGLWALAAVAFSTCAHTTLRALGASERPTTVVFWFQVAVFLQSALVISLWPGLHWQLPELQDTPWLVGIGVGATMGQVLMTRAYQADRAATVAAASHIGPVWGVLIDLVIFGVLPATNTILGGAVVMVAVLWLVFRPQGLRGAPSQPG